jgi:cation:H+ antiporter
MEPGYRPTMLTLVLLGVSLAIILAAAELFTNAVEWTGHKLSLNEGVVGSVLAAVGTAMPETLIPIVAILFVGGGHGQEVGLGAILGAPFMLATLAMFVTGLAIVIFARRGRRTTELQVNSRVLARDIRFFLIAYLIAIAAAFVESFPVKVVLAVAVVGVYVFYVYKHATDVEEPPANIEGMSPLEVLEALRNPVEAHELARLHFHRSATDPSLAVVIGQLVVSLVIMLGGSYLFVEAVNTVAAVLGVPALILSLLIAPVATELPEKFNSVLWVRNSKDTLALGNLTGAMVFQSAIPAAFGMLLSDWAVTPETTTAFVSAGIAIVAAALIFGTLTLGGGRKLTAKALLSGGLFYLVYIGYVFLAQPAASH